MLIAISSFYRGSGLTYEKHRQSHKIPLSQIWAKGLIWGFSENVSIRYHGKVFIFYLTSIFIWALLYNIIFNSFRHIYMDQNFSNKKICIWNSLSSPFQISCSLCNDSTFQIYYFIITFYHRLEIPSQQSRESEGSASGSCSHGLLSTLSATGTALGKWEPDLHLVIMCIQKDKGDP